LPDRDWLPLRVSDDGIAVTVTLNGVPVEALIDTGSNRTLVDSAFAKMAKVGSGNGSETLQSYTDGVSAARAGSVEITIGRFKARTTPVTMSFGPQLPEQRLIIGRDAFPREIITFDFSRNRLRVCEVAAFSPPEGYVLVSRQLGRTENRPVSVMTANLDPMMAQFEGHDVEANLDTGNSSALSVSSAFANRVGLLEGRKVSARMFGNVAGSRPWPLLTCRSFSLGPVTLKDVPTQVFEDDRDQATLGLELFQRFDSAVDVVRQDVWLKPAPNRAAAPFRRERSGLSYRPIGGSVEVVFVAPNSPAARGGWRIGDRIDFINGVEAASAPPIWKRGAAGTHQTLTMRDGSQRVLVLDDYY
jgi:predicted aspartyl protease